MVKSLSSDSRKSAFGEAARRSLETCSAGRAGAHRAAPDARERIPALAEWLGPIISAVYTCYFGDRTLGPPTGSFSRAKQLNHSNACTHHTSFSKNATPFETQKRGGTGVDAFARNRTDWKGIATTRAPDFSNALKLAG